MQLVFESVSYAYSAPGKKKAGKRSGKGAAGEVAAAAASTTDDTSTGTTSDSSTKSGKKHFWNRSRKAGQQTAGSFDAFAETNGGSTKAQAELDKPAWGNDPKNEYALRDVSFTLNEGEFLGICGHTGSGKSTLIQHMNGLLRPTCGRVLLDGANLADKKTQKTCCGAVGVVFQYPEHQLFAQTVYDDVAFGPCNLGLSEDEVDARVREALKNVDLDFETLSAKSPFELSGGQQRRVAFAGVLAMRPHILVLDEPAAGLDPKARAGFLGLIENLHAQGLTVVMVSHSMEDLARLTDQLLVLNQGQVFAQGTPAEVFADDEGLRSIGLDVPAAQRTANALRKRGITLPRPLYTNAKDLADDIAAALGAGDAR